MTGEAANGTVGRGDLLRVQGLVVEFDQGRHRAPLRAVDGIDLHVGPKETVGLVGESGSGKSTLGRAVLGLTPIEEGTVHFDGADITHADRRARRRLSAALQVVFQDPYSSLNPTRSVGQTLSETLRVHEPDISRADLEARAREMLERVGLPAEAVKRYPRQFSGGQRQRIAIARALMVSPRLVICDEAVSALDVSVQAQVLNLLRELQREYEMSYLFIAHDLAVVRHLSERIVVMYRGRVMEHGPARTVYDRPGHPYTQALLAAEPLPDPDSQRSRRLARIPQGQRGAPTGADSCPFAPRCPHVIDACWTTRPKLERTRAGAEVACIRWRDLESPQGRIGSERPDHDEDGARV